MRSAARKHWCRFPMSRILGPREQSHTAIGTFEGDPCQRQYTEGRAEAPTVPYGWRIKKVIAIQCWIAGGG